ncbi:2761_t:CDS:2 [Entrophospora sp. SA101]|nr:2761_t:CDS:2 [Entrophospora sp. SA101]
MKGTFYTITYLQRLSIEYFELILEFATWALENDPDNGMDIFIDDFPDVQNFTKRSILELRQICQKCKSDNSNQADMYLEETNITSNQLLKFWDESINGEQVTIESALRLLLHVDGTEALNMLPAATKVSELYSFLRNTSEKVIKIGIWMPLLKIC